MGSNSRCRLSFAPHFFTYVKNFPLAFADHCSMKLSGNTILITGATSGIGLEMARRFHALDNQIIAIGRNEEKLMAMEGEMEALTGIACDLSNPHAVAQLAATVAAQFPATNVLINNAGVQVNYSVLSAAQPHALDAEIDVNLRAVVQLTHALLPQLMAQPKAAIVNISSGLAFAPKKSAPVYSATKAGVHAFTQGLRYQLEGTEVAVFEVIPPLVDTPMTAGRNAEKLSVQEMVSEFTYAFRKNHFEVNIGKVKILRALMRLWPARAYAILKNA